MSRGRRATRGLWRRWLGICLVGLVLAACQLGDSTYFDQSGADAESLAAIPGTHIVAGIGGPLEIRPGDHVQLLGLDTGSADVARVLVTVASRMHDGYIATARLSEMTPEDLDGYAPLANQVFSSSDGPIAILLDVVVPDHDITILTPILKFSVNGGSHQQERLMTNVRVCSRPSNYDDCPLIDPPR
jgi:hypothetical protein